MCQKMRTEGEKGGSIKIDKGAQRYNSNKGNKKECNEKIYKKNTEPFPKKKRPRKSVKKGERKDSKRSQTRRKKTINKGAKGNKKI